MDMLELEQYGIEFTGNWDRARKMLVLEAIRLVGAAFAKGLADVSSPAKNGYHEQV